MTDAVRAVFTTAILISLAACGGTQSGMRAKTAHAKIRVIIKKDGGICKSRTVPKHHELLKDEEGELVWSIKDRDNCLTSNDLVIKWTSGNPSVCSEVTTKANGNKNEVKCDLDAGATVGTKYDYKLYLRNSSNVDTVIEDPDVEIVMF